MEIEKLITVLSIVGMIIAWGKDLLKLRSDELARQKEEQAKTRADLQNDYDRCCKERDRLLARMDEERKEFDAERAELKDTIKCLEGEVDAWRNRRK